MACIASSGETASKKRFHVQAAVATQQMTKMPVLLTAPDTVMLSPKVASPVRKVSPLKAGFEVLISCAMEFLLAGLAYLLVGEERHSAGRCSLFAFRQKASDRVSLELSSRAQPRDLRLLAKAQCSVIVAAPNLIADKRRHPRVGGGS